MKHFSSDYITSDQHPVLFALLLLSIDWHKAAQALYSFGYVILLSTLLLAMLHLCCRFCCRRPFSLATVIGSLVIAGCMYLRDTIHKMSKRGFVLCRLNPVVAVMISIDVEGDCASTASTSRVASCLSSTVAVCRRHISR